MLGQRIVTAIVLLAILLPAMFSTLGWPFVVVTLVLVAAAGWEWGRLNAAPSGLALGFGALLALACLGAWKAGWTERAPMAAWATAALIWIVGGSAALRAGPAAWPHVSKAARWLIGLIALWMAWLALVQARAWGINFVLSVLALVWTADIAAYFGGRAFGRRKLAPTISPGKTWAGAYTGAAAVLVLGWIWHALDRSMVVDSASLFSRLEQRWGWALCAVAVIGLSAMSVVGDLMESLVKRAAGAKDSSGLLPGHGGVLDRVDALLPVFPVALALTSW